MAKDFKIDSQTPADDMYCLRWKTGYTVGRFDHPDWYNPESANPALCNGRYVNLADIGRELCKYGGIENTTAKWINLLASSGVLLGICKDYTLIALVDQPRVVELTYLYRLPIKLSLPYLIWSARFEANQTYANTQSIKLSCAIDTPLGPSAVVYRWPAGNVYPSHKICWGSVTAPQLTIENFHTVRSAFLETEFNADLMAPGPLHSYALGSYGIPGVDADHPYKIAGLLTNPDVLGRLLMEVE